MLEPSEFDIEMSTERIQEHKSPGIYQITTELTIVCGRNFLCVFYKFNNSNSKKEK